jgi:hypothetical protein
MKITVDSMNELNNEAERLRIDSDVSTEIRSACLKLEIAALEMVIALKKSKMQK